MTLRLLKCQTQLSVSGQNPAFGLVHWLKEPECLPNQCEIAAINYSTNAVEFVLHHTLERSAICTRVPMDLGDACAQVRTRDSDFDCDHPCISDGSVFMDADIRRAATEHQACDKSRMILWMTSSRLQLMNLCVCAHSCKQSKTTPGTHGPHHEDILDFNVHVGSFKTGFLRLFFSNWLLLSSTSVHSRLRVWPEDCNLVLSTYKYIHTHAYTHCYPAPYTNPNHPYLPLIWTLT